ncbi:MAG: hypothetical protein ACRC9T_02210, partial [Vibrionaceae bacterium]
MVQLIEAFVAAINSRSAAQQAQPSTAAAAASTSGAQGGSGQQALARPPPLPPRFQRPLLENPSGGAAAQALPDTAPTGFLHFAVFDDGNRLQPYIAGEALKPNSIVIKTDPVTRKSSLELV